jgi:LPS O-antigen subunit length determinant protein (WzzB/FepE family)
MTSPLPSRPRKALVLAVGLAALGGITFSLVLSALVVRWTGGREYA